MGLEPSSSTAAVGTVRIMQVLLTIMKVILTAVVTLLAVILIGAIAVGAFATTGIVNVAATADYLPGAEWFFSTLSDNSIRKQAQKAVDEGRITPPGEISESMLDDGRHHFQEMCVICHGAPGVERGEIGAGQKPIPPDLGHTAGEMSMEEIYWVVANGIRHTGMPAFGETHSAEELWGLAAFVDRLDTISPEEYVRLTGGEPAATSHEMPRGEEESDAGDGHTDHTH